MNCLQAVLGLLRFKTFQCGTPPSPPVHDSDTWAPGICKLLLSFSRVPEPTPLILCKNPMCQVCPFKKITRTLVSFKVTNVSWALINCDLSMYFNIATILLGYAITCWWKGPRIAPAQLPGRGFLLCWEKLRSHGAQQRSLSPFLLAIVQVPVLAPPWISQWWDTVLCKAFRCERNAAK